MGKASKAIGFILLLYGLVCFLVNFQIWQPALIGGIHVLWNPLDALFTGRIVGGIPFISGTIGSILSYIFALIYSGILGIISLILMLH